MSFTPFALVGTMNTTAKFFPCTGMSPWCATNVKWVERRAGRDHLGPGHVDAGVRLLGDARVDVGRAAGRAGRHVAVDRRMDDRVVDERDALLSEYWYQRRALAWYGA